jgi:biotin synthase
MRVQDILNQEHFSKKDLIAMLASEDEEQQLLFDKAKEIKQLYIGNVVHFRGLMEYSNVCSKNCYYCGIRSGNKQINRYTASDEEILQAAKLIMENRYGSMVLQSGECSNEEFTLRITLLVKEIKRISNNKIGITLSCGEQSESVYNQWFEAGVHRYLLRIETSNPQLYAKWHPQNKKHDYQKRVQCLKNLQKIGYQVGTGVMIGVPFQNIENLAEDLLFFKEKDMDMIGMGPYLIHKQTPMADYFLKLLTIEQRFNISLNMIASLRILMKDVNIAASTAMQTLHPFGREKAIEVGANIVMPNITPLKYRENYKLYEDKPSINEDAEETKNQLEKRILSTNHSIGYDQWGNSAHFENKLRIRN